MNKKIDKKANKLDRINYSNRMSLFDKCLNLKIFAIAYNMCYNHKNLILFIWKLFFHFMLIFNSFTNKMLFIIFN